MSCVSFLSFYFFFFCDACQYDSSIVMSCCFYFCFHSLDYFFVYMLFFFFVLFIFCIYLFNYLSLYIQFITHDTMNNRSYVMPCFFFFFHVLSQKLIKIVNIFPSFSHICFSLKIKIVIFSPKLNIIFSPFPLYIVSYACPSLHQRCLSDHIFFLFIFLFIYSNH